MALKKLKDTNVYPEIEGNVNGIPCIIGVLYVNIVKPWRGSPWTCDNPFDYYGYEEIEYMLFDRKGYEAPWLEKIADREDIEKQILDYLEEEAAAAMEP